VGDHSAETFEPLWVIVAQWSCYFYVTDGWKVYPQFIPDGDQIVCKTYMTRVEGENTRLILNPIDISYVKSAIF
jgi:insertion element IS1 protein InsB